MHGLEEYLTYIDHPQCERFCILKRAIMYGDISFIKELISGEIYRGHIDLTDEFLNIILSHYNSYQEIDNRKVLRYVSYCIDSEYVRKISSWSIKWQNRANLNDHFSRGQMKSKCWMVEQLLKAFPDKKLGTVVHYGGWYATVAQNIFEKFEVKNYYNLELDKNCIEISDEFNYKQYQNNWQFKSICHDVSTIRYNQDGSFDTNIRNIHNVSTPTNITPNLIINTSCEHMDEQWFHNLPDGTMVCLQTNNYFSNEQHINCVKGIIDAKAKYPMKEFLYEGEIETHLYNRFMLIGKK
jgi:small nuclear ribonucleoprotein (snRNP)-like protein